ncbi:MAG: sigma-E factor negative regulatory protein [Ectothiorhodospiraceae bacterium]|nr:sigma-E factor negative regulatory protein [Ectothiorhodospiraceae bacterium]MCH8503047.1 sigma-E factor negative regulatory protein [Ectothiorhodospiraceae bacterium]
MTRAYDEQVSALADDELSQAEFDQLIRQAGGETEIGRRLQRYALIRDALHRNLPERLSTGDALANRVSALLEQEPAHTMVAPVARKPALGRWTRPVAGMALAASVAMLAVVIWPGSEAPDSGAPTATVASSGTSTGTGVRTVSSDNIRWDRLDPDVQARLNGYAISHGEQSGTRQVGIMPRHVRITGHGSAEQ